MNKARERATIEACLASLGYPLACLIDCSRERPDALARIDGDLVGIEVTTVVEAHPRQSVAPQKWRTEATRLVKNAQLISEGSGLGPVVAWLTFRPGWQPGAIDSASLAQELADTVAAALAAPGPFRRPGAPVTPVDPHPVLSRLYVASASHGGSEGHWVATLVGNVVQASAADIRVTVDKKEPELVAYRAASSRVWLLIDCDLTGQGVALDVPEPFTVQTGFDRVLCCGFGMWRWVELPTTRKVRNSGAGA